MQLGISLVVLVSYPADTSAYAGEWAVRQRTTMAINPVLIVTKVQH